jgi:hypothetical protein
MLTLLLLLGAGFFAAVWENYLAVTIGAAFGFAFWWGAFYNVPESVNGEK